MANKNLSPQLLYAFSNYLFRKDLNIDDVRGTDGISSEDVDLTTFLEVMFCEALDSTAGNTSEIYPYSSFRYLFRELTTKDSWDITCRTKGSVYPSTVKYYVCDNNEDSTNNLFNLEADDLTLLRKLLEYKTTGTTDISGIVYSNLTTKLSKLIYIYLDAMLNSSYTYYDTSSLVSDSTSLVECMFESYVINEIFEKVSSS